MSREAITALTNQEPNMRHENFRVLNDYPNQSS